MGWKLRAILLAIFALVGGIHHALASDFYFYGRLTKPYTVGNQNLPPGSYVAVIYEISDDFEIKTGQGTQRIPKSAVTMVDQVLFNPALGAVARNDTDVYAVAPALALDAATLRQKDGTEPLHRGALVSVQWQQGDDYIVRIPALLDRLGRVPVSSLNITSGSPKSGQHVALTRASDRPITQMPIARTETPPPDFTERRIVVVGCAVLVLAGLVVLIFFRRGRKTKTRLPSYNSTYPKDFTPELKARFPSNVLYFVPEEICEILKIPPDEPMPSLYERYFDEWWNPLLKLYPTSPQNNHESREREAVFWRNKAQQMMTTTHSGETQLWPKQQIFDYFKHWEKWIFREYYAATGTVHQTIAENFVRNVLDLEYAHAIKTFGDSTSVSNTQKRHEIEKAEDAQRRLVREEIPAHFERWGGWFFFNVEQAFNEMYDTETDYGPQSAATQAQHPADDEISYRPRR